MQLDIRPALSSRQILAGDFGFYSVAAKIAFFLLFGNFYT
jgi:hypothetical protein